MIITRLMSVKLLYLTVKFKWLELNNPQILCHSNNFDRCHDLFLVQKFSMSAAFWTFAHSRDLIFLGYVSRIRDADFRTVFCIWSFKNSQHSYCLVDAYKIRSGFYLLYRINIIFASYFLFNMYINVSISFWYFLNIASKISNIQLWRQLLLHEINFTYFTNYLLYQILL